jgi:hypothetical protein
MTLVICPECAKQVSDQATSCPHCGRPLRHSVGSWLRESWPKGLCHAQKGALAYPIAWLATTIVSLVQGNELSHFRELLPRILSWICLLALFGFGLSAAVILLTVWLRSWLGDGEGTRDVWSWSSQVVAVTWVFFLAWIILST